jgi:hypothetical protein
MLLFGAQAILAGALIATLIRKNMENDPLRSTGAIYNINTPTRGDVAKARGNGTRSRSRRSGAVSR